MPYMTDLQRAAQVWAVLVFAAHKSKKVVLYSELSKFTGITGPVARQLGYIQRYCIEEMLPPLTAIVVHKDGTAGTGLYTATASELSKAQKAVFNHDWFSIPKTPTTTVFEDHSAKWLGYSKSKREEILEIYRKNMSSLDRLREILRKNKSSLDILREILRKK